MEIFGYAIDWGTVITAAITIGGCFIAVIIGIGKLSHKIGNWQGTVDTKIKNLESGLSDVKSDINSIRGDIKDLSDKVINFMTNGSRSVRETKSPIQLNDFGTEINNAINDAINSDELVKKYAPSIDVSSDENAYQIQQNCFSYTRDVLPKQISDEERNSLETIAYEKGVSMDSIFGVLGVVFRDAKLKEFNKKHDEIDTHDPEVEADES